MCAGRLQILLINRVFGHKVRKKSLQKTCQRPLIQRNQTLQNPTEVQYATSWMVPERKGKKTAQRFVWSEAGWSDEQSVFYILMIIFEGLTMHFHMKNSHDGVQTITALKIFQMCLRRLPAVSHHRHKNMEKKINVALAGNKCCDNAQY